MARERTGGCFCGAVRYRVEGEPIDAGYCHCRMCQRTTGAPVVAWGSWDAAGFGWLTAEPMILPSSAQGQRRFCGACGTHILFWTAAEPEIVDINLVTLDHPGQVAPQYHIWTDSRIPWFDTADQLPRYRDRGIDSREHRARRE